MPNRFVDLNQRNIFVWCLLAFQAGAVNAGGFLACGRFVTHTTGFATHFAYDLVTHQVALALGMLSVPGFFLLGAMITSYFVDLRLSQGQKANYQIPSALIFLCFVCALLLGKLGVFGIFGTEIVLRQDYLLLVLLCLASGLQNALITNASGIVVRTTHLTGITTDLGVGLVRTFFSKAARAPERVQHDRLASFARAGILLSFVLGSTVAALLYLRAQYLGFAVPVFTSLILLRYFGAADFRRM